MRTAHVLHGQFLKEKERFMSRKLEDARAYEKRHLEEYQPSNRPLFHVTGPVGWVNDPNGFCVYQGEYHLFYQYHPYSTHWGPMHWGHSKSKDLLHWEYLPCALAPDTDADKDGCFSGSAITLEDGRQLLMYTGVVRREDENGQMQDYQQQCVAVGDGVDYEKVVQNPVISTDMIPEGGNVHDFRDPKIIRHGDNYYCFVINRHPDGSGQILVYESKDGISWKYNKVLDRSDNKVGRIWECPDYFALDDKKVLIVSPQEVEGDGTQIYPGYNNFFLLGEGEEFLDFHRQTVQPIDFGTDFYAAQTIESIDGRRIMIAWMQNWETSNYGNERNDYYGMMTMPRELSVQDGHVYQLPICEISNNYGKTVAYRHQYVQAQGTISGIEGRTFDMTIILEPDVHSDYDFTLRIAKDERHETRIHLDTRTNMMRLDRSQSGVRISALASREFALDVMEKKHKLRVLMDRYAVEVFLDDGRQVASMKVDTELTAKEITFESQSSLYMDVEFHELCDAHNM